MRDLQEQHPRVLSGGLREDRLRRRRVFRSVPRPEGRSRFRQGDPLDAAVGEGAAGRSQIPQFQGREGLPVEKRFSEGSVTGPRRGITGRCRQRDRGPAVRREIRRGRFFHFAASPPFTQAPRRECVTARTTGPMKRPMMPKATRPRSRRRRSAAGEGPLPS